MQKTVKHVCMEVGPFTDAPAIDEIDCSKLSRGPGGVLRIRQAPEARLDRVIVSIHGEISGMLEAAVADHEPDSLDWFYTTRTQVPEGEGVLTEVKAVPCFGAGNTTVILDETPDRISFEVSSGDETRRVDIWKHGRPDGSGGSIGRDDMVETPTLASKRAALSKTAVIAHVSEQ